MLTNTNTDMSTNTDKNSKSAPRANTKEDSGRRTSGKLFRERPLEELSTPDQLSGYLRVTGSGVWIALAGIVVLLAGLLVWSISARLAVTVQVPALVKGGELSCYVRAEDVDPSEEEITITIGDVVVQAATADARSMTMGAVDREGLYASGYVTPGSIVEVFTCAVDLEDGLYNAAVTTDTVRPVSLLFARN